MARLIQSTYVLWNNDMAYFVEGPRRMSPSRAREELIRINDQLFREVVKQAVMVLGLVGALNAVIALMRANSQLVANLANQREGGVTFGSGAADYNVAYAGHGRPRAGSWRSGPRAGSGGSAEQFNRGSAGAGGRLPSGGVDELADTVLFPRTRPGIPVTRPPDGAVPNNEARAAGSPALPGATEEYFARLRDPRNVIQDVSQEEALRRFQTANTTPRRGSCFLGPNSYALYRADWQAVGAPRNLPAFGFRILGPDGEVLYFTVFMLDASRAR